MRGLPFGLQMFTVREAAAKDMAGTYRKVKGIGYNAVETLTGMTDFSAAEHRKMLDDAGLTPVSDHVLFEVLTGDTQRVADAAETLGVKYVTLPFLGGPLCPDKAAWVRCMDAIDRAGETLRTSGIQLCYHNHAHEFQPLNGARILDVLYERTQPENVAAELDAYWVQYGGADPVAYLKKMKGRVPLLHVKDMTAGEPKTFTEVGRGILDWPAIFDAAADAGVEWYIVEQDVCPGDPFESARISAEFMAAQ